MSVPTAQQKEARESLLKILKPGDTLYTILRHVSRSGTSRHISVIHIDDKGPYEISHLVARLLDYRRDRDDGGIIISGGGMDMGFETVYELGRALFRDGFKVSGMGRNGDTSGWDKDGGYAIQQRWL
jgi:hypothetical protein